MNFLDMLNKKNDEEQEYQFEKPEFEPVSVADNFISSIDAPEMLEKTPPRDPLAEGASDLSPFYANTTQDSEEDDNTDKGGKQQDNNLETLYKDYMANIGSRQQRIKDAAEADRRKRLIQNLSNAFSKIGTGLASGYANVKLDPIDLGPANEEARARAEQKGQLEDLLTQYKLKKAMTPEQMSRLDEAKLAKEQALAAKYKAEKERMEAPQSEMEKIQLQTAQERLKQLREPKEETKITKLKEERQKNIADRYDTLQEQVPNSLASINEADFLIKEIERGNLSTGPFEETMGRVGSFFGTKESALKERLDALAEKAARAQLKANGETRPTDADVEGMKRAMFNLGNTEETNIEKLKQFIKQQKSTINEYTQMRNALKTGEGLENFLLDPTYDPQKDIKEKSVDNPMDLYDSRTKNAIYKFMEANNIKNEQEAIDILKKNNKL